MEPLESIWIVDDDEIFTFGFKRILKSNGMAEEVNVFTEGATALLSLDNHISENKPLPNVIFLDINMPVMDGWQFLENYEAKGGTENSPPILFMLSSSVDEVDLERAKSIQLLKGYITKPIYPATIKEVLEKL